MSRPKQKRGNGTALSQAVQRKAIYPGSFDPITNGHVDIIQRGTKIFDKLIVAVLENPEKTPTFTTKDRVSMIEEIFADEAQIEVISFKGLLIDFVKKTKANIVMRGLRVISDFEYEFQMALMNRQLAPDVETLFMMPNVNYTFLSSKLVKEISLLGGNTKGFVPREVEKRLTQLKKRKKNN